MSRLQKFILRLLPASWAKAAEAESREWHMRCPACGRERTLWDSSGIRWRASGSTWVLMRCADCRKWRFQKMFRVPKL
jgi:ribosomal protein S27E